MRNWIASIKPGLLLIRFDLIWFELLHWWRGLLGHKNFIRPTNNCCNNDNINHQYHYYCFSWGLLCTRYYSNIFNKVIWKIWWLVLTTFFLYIWGKNTGDTGNLNFRAKNLEIGDWYWIRLSLEKNFILQYVLLSPSSMHIIVEADILNIFYITHCIEMYKTWLSFKNSQTSSNDSRVLLFNLLYF